MSIYNQKIRDKFLSEHESLVQESNAPLEARDNCNQEATRRLFQEDGRSDFEHQVWRETEMLPEMIRLLQENYLKLNPQEQQELIIELKNNFEIVTKELAGLKAK